MKKGEPTYLSTMVKSTKENKENVDPSREFEGVLKEYVDIMPAKLPKKLPCRREVDHKIKLELGVKPPTKAPY